MADLMMSTVSMHQKNSAFAEWRTLRRWSKAMKEFRLLIVRPIAIVYCYVEYFFMVLCQYRALKAAEYVYPLWFWSFGHQATDPHMLALRFHGKKLLVLLSDYRDFNHPIVDAFRPHLTIVDFHHVWRLRCLKALEITRIQCRVLRFVLAFLRRRTVVVTTIFETLATPMEGYYLTEYIDLLSTSEPSVVQAPTEHIQSFTEILKRTYPALAERWFVSLYFRKKRIGENEVRDMNPATYVDAIQLVCKNGGWVFCGGDFDSDDVLPGMDNVLTYQDFPCDRALCDLYFLTQCRFLVCGQSGPLAIAIAFATPTLVMNAALYYICGCRSNQRIHYKKLTERSTGRVLRAQEIFSLPTLCFSSNKQFNRAGLLHVDNTSADIATGVDDMLALCLSQKDSTQSVEYQELFQRYHALLPVGSMVEETPCKPTFSYLRSLQF